MPFETIKRDYKSEIKKEKDNLEQELQRTAAKGENEGKTNRMS